MRAPDPGFASWAVGLATAARSLSGGWCAAAMLLACSLACSSAAHPAPAAPVLSPAPVPVAPSGVALSSYRAPLGCPDEQAYVSSVESRSQTLRLHTGPEQTQLADRLRVRIAADTGSAGWRGELQIEGEHPLQREVRGERCEDVALALALIAVLRLDAQARSAQSTVPARPAAPSARATPSAAGAAAAPVEQTQAAGGSGAAQSLVEPADDVLLPDSAVQIVRSRGRRRSATGDESLDPDAAPSRDAAERASAGSAWQPSIAAHLGYVSAPSHALQARLRAELQLGPRLQSGSLALGFGYAGASDQNASANLDFALLSAQLDVCPLALGAASWLRACATLSGGVFAVSAQALDDDLVSQSSTRGWAGAGPSLEAGFALGSRWTLRALAEVSFLLVRDSFEVERIVGDEAGQPSQITRTLLYRPPFGSFAASLGLGYAF